MLKNNVQERVQWFDQNLLRMGNGQIVLNEDEEEGRTGKPYLQDQQLCYWFSETR